MDGLQTPSPEMFVGRVRELKEEIIARRLAGHLQKELDVQLKTGLPMDLAEILQDVDELRRLRQPKDVAVIGLDKIEPKPISWLWPGRIPKGMLTLLVGDPGVGKSFCSIALAARLSRGQGLPDSPVTMACSSLFILGEDPAAEAVRPRADANGADVSRILLLRESEFHLTDTPKLRWILERHNDVGLIVIDPLTAFFPAKTKWIEDPSIRQSLLPLVDLAEETGVAVLAICHFRKAETDDIIYKVAGSIGLAGIARSILAVTYDESDRERRLLLPIKASYSRRPSGLAFRIAGEEMDAKIVFEDRPIETAAEDVLSSSEKKEATAERSFNERWLLDFLKDGPKIFQEIEKESPGISRRTLFRLADKLEQNGKLERAPGTAGRFKIWRLPS
jgi:RecA-family ATPase